jgi:hypothetical protein
MNASILLLAILWLGTSCTHFLQAQSSEKKGPQILGSNAEGYHFMVGFMQNELDYYQTSDGPFGGCDYGTVKQKIQMASRFATHVKVTGQGAWPIERDLAPFEVWTLPVDRYYECIDEGVFKKGIEIEATTPISVYCFSSRETTSDGYQALPINSWGTQYISANYYLDYYDPDPNEPKYNYCDTYPRGGELAVIAGFDSTQVTVVPNAYTRGGVARGSYYTKVLMKGEIFQVQDGGIIKGGSDLTGSMITSSKPVGLLSGHVRAAIPYTMTSRNHLIEMLPPRNTFGKRYMIAPFGGHQGGDVVRIIAGEAGGTSVTVQTATATTTYDLLNIGNFAQVILEETAVITANRRVLVTQYCQSQGIDPRNAGKPVPVVPFDPYMVVVTPEEQFVNGAVFQTLPEGSNSFGGKQFDHQHMTIIAEAKNFNTIELNGENLSSNPNLVTALIPNTTYRWATLELDPNKIHTLQGDALFGGYVYGIGNADSYGWPIGAGLRKFDIPDGNPPVLTAEKICGGYDIFVKDSGFFETGLSKVWLDTSESINTSFTPGSFISRGIEYAIGRVTLLDARSSGVARIIASDLDNNRDTIDVYLQNASPKFSRDSITFDNVLLNTTVSDIITISNPTAVDMLIDTLMLMRGQGFALDRTYIPFTLTPGAKIDVRVSFAGVERKTYYDSLLVVVNCEHYKTPLRATIPAPEISVHNLDFGSLRVGKQKCLTLTMRSIGGGPLRIDSLVLQGKNRGFLIPKNFTFPFTLESGRDTTLTVCFTPMGTYRHDDTIRIFNNSSRTGIATLTGVGIYPKLGIGPYDFGLLQVGDTACAEVPIINMGTDTAHLTGLELGTPKGFIPDQGVFPRDLAPGDTLWVPICFAPTEEGDYLSDIFPLNTDGLEDAMNQVRGLGYRLLATISGYDWKNRWVGTSHDTLVFVRNLGNEPITIDSIRITAGDIGDFNAEPLPAPVVLAKGDSIPVKVRFTPMLAGLRMAVISAVTSSRVVPQIDSVLQGFGLMALASDSLAFDTSLAYSCVQREGQVIIYNDGNTPLTISRIWFDATPAPAVLLNAPSPGYTIAVGQELTLDFTADLAGGSDVSGRFYWQFEELPDTFSQSFALKGEPQEFFISAMTPPSYSIGQSFDLLVTVDSAHWVGTPHTGLSLRVEFNPTVANFSPNAWQERIDTSTIAWVSSGRPVFEKPGVLLLNFVPRSGAVASLDSLTFPALPFWGYLGNSELDTFHITMSVAEQSCAPPTLATAPYQVDSLCGLNYRLIEIMGAPYVLKQNTPNPVRMRTSISFTLGMEAGTTLEVFSNDGKLVETLINQQLPAGDYTIPLNVREFPSGLYYYRLTSGPFSSIRHMLVTK